MSAAVNPAGRVLLVGGGNMGGAMARGWVAENRVPAGLTVVDPNLHPSLAPLADAGRLSHRTSVPGNEAFDIVVLAVKPQMMAQALPALVPAMTAGTLVISVAAGTTVATLAAALGNDAAVVRAMPNTPALIGRGITGAYAGPGVTEAMRAAATSLLEASGAVVWVEREADIDAVTAVSGSGPAYVFLLAEAMAKAGEAAGLSADLAMTLARHTVAGAGELMIRASEAPAELRRNVTSPNGTTEAALAVLMREADGLETLIGTAVAAAKRRAGELAGS